MAQAISVSLEDDVYAALNNQLTDYGDNRSELVNQALKEKLEGIGE